jgi:hypothetical protein
MQASTKRRPRKALSEIFLGKIWPSGRVPHPRGTMGMLTALRNLSTTSPDQLTYSNTSPSLSENSFFSRAEACHGEPTQLRPGTADQHRCGWTIRTCRLVLRC